MKSPFHCFLAFVALAVTSIAAETGSTATASTTPAAPAALAEEYAQLQSDLDAAWKEFFRPELEAKTPEESLRIKNDLTRERPDVRFRPRFQDLARRAGNSDIGYAAWRQVFRMSRYRYSTTLKDCQEATENIFRDYMQSPIMESFPELLVDGAYNSEGQAKRREIVDATLLEIISKSPVPEVRASALAARARFLTRIAPKISKQVASELAEKYPSSKAARELKNELFARENLVVGRPALDFEAVDQDGKKFKLSDYRGKVIVVDFWAFWCVPCVQAMPHHIAMVERLKDRPFAMIGVDADKDHAFFARRAKEIGINFRNAMDGKTGEIAKTWQVGAWPTVFVIDAKGIIRAKNEGGEELDRTVEALLSEIK